MRVRSWLVALVGARWAEGTQEVQVGGVKVKYTALPDDWWQVEATYKWTTTANLEYLAVGFSNTQSMDDTQVVLGRTRGGGVTVYNTSGYLLNGPFSILFGQFRDASFSKEPGVLSLNFTCKQINSLSLSSAGYILAAAGTVTTNGIPNRHTSSRRGAEVFTKETASPTPQPTSSPPTPQPTSSPTSSPSTPVPSQPPSPTSAPISTNAPTGAPSTKTPTDSPTTSPTGRAPTAPIGAGESVPIFDSKGFFTFGPAASNSAAKIKVSYPGNVWLSVAINAGSAGSPVMIGSHAIVSSCSQPAGEFECVLTDKFSGCQEQASSNVSESSCKFENGMMTWEFSTSSIAGRALNVNGIDSLLLAAGESSSFGLHTYAQELTVNWAQGTSAVESEVSDSALYKAHAFLMVLGILFSFPLGVFSSVFRSLLGSPTWFKVHKALQGVGILLVLVAFLILVIAHPEDIVSGNHQILGLTIVIAALVQPMLTGIRKGKFRPLWKLQHFVFAIFLLAGGTVNCFLGILRVNDARNSGIVFMSKDTLLALWVLSSIGAALCVVAIFSHLVARIMFPRPDPHAASKAGVAANQQVENASSAGTPAESAGNESTAGTAPGVTEVELTYPLTDRVDPPFFKYDPDVKNDDVTTINLT